MRLSPALTVAVAVSASRQVPRDARHSSSVRIDTGDAPEGPSVVFHCREGPPALLQVRAPLLHVEGGGHDTLGHREFVHRLAHVIAAQLLEENPEHAPSGPPDDTETRLRASEVITVAMGACGTGKTSLLLGSCLADGDAVARPPAPFDSSRWLGGGTAVGDDSQLSWGSRSWCHAPVGGGALRVDGSEWSPLVTEHSSATAECVDVSLVEAVMALLFGGVPAARPAPAGLVSTRLADAEYHGQNEPARHGRIAHVAVSALEFRPVSPGPLKEPPPHGSLQGCEAVDLLSGDVEGPPSPPLADGDRFGYFFEEPADIPACQYALCTSAEDVRYVLRAAASRSVSWCPAAAASLHGSSRLEVPESNRSEVRQRCHAAALEREQDVEGWGAGSGDPLEVPPRSASQSLSPASGGGNSHLLLTFLIELPSGRVSLWRLWDLCGPHILGFTGTASAKLGLQSFTYLCKHLYEGPPTFGEASHTVHREIDPVGHLITCAVRESCTNVVQLPFLRCDWSFDDINEDVLRCTQRAATASSSAAASSGNASASARLEARRRRAERQEDNAHAAKRVLCCYAQPVSSAFPTMLTSPAPCTPRGGDRWLEPSITPSSLHGATSLVLDSPALEDWSARRSGATPTAPASEAQGTPTAPAGVAAPQIPHGCERSSPLSWAKTEQDSRWRVARQESSPRSDSYGRPPSVASTSPAGSGNDSRGTSSTDTFAAGSVDGKDEQTAEASRMAYSDDLAPPRTTRLSPWKRVQQLLLDEQHRQVQSTGDGGSGRAMQTGSSAPAASPSLASDASDSGIECAVQPSLLSRNRSGVRGHPLSTVTERAEVHSRRGCHVTAFQSAAQPPHPPSGVSCFEPPHFHSTDVLGQRFAACVTALRQAIDSFDSSVASMEGQLHSFSEEQSRMLKYLVSCVEEDAEAMGTMLHLCCCTGSSSTTTNTASAAPRGEGDRERCDRLLKQVVHARKKILYLERLLLVQQGAASASAHRSTSIRSLVSRPVAALRKGLDECAKLSQVVHEATAEGTPHGWHRRRGEKDAWSMDVANRANPAQPPAPEPHGAPVGEPALHAVHHAAGLISGSSAETMCIVHRSGRTGSKSCTQSSSDIDGDPVPPPSNRWSNRAMPDTVTMSQLSVLLLRGVKAAPNTGAVAPFTVLLDEPRSRSGSPAMENDRHLPRMGPACAIRIEEGSETRGASGRVRARLPTSLGELPSSTPSGASSPRDEHGIVVADDFQSTAVDQVALPPHRRLTEAASQLTSGTLHALAESKRLLVQLIEETEHHGAPARLDDRVLDVQRRTEPLKAALRQIDCEEERVKRALGQWRSETAAASMELLEFAEREKQYLNTLLQ